MDKYWYSPGIIPEEDFVKWVHICLEINAEDHTIRTSVNGKELNNLTNVEGLTPTPKLSLRLGIVDHSSTKKKIQFHGKVSNINVLNPRARESLTSLTRDLCSIDNRTSSFISWSDMSWTKKDIQETCLDSGIICALRDFLPLKVPYTWSLSAGGDMCSMLGNGNLAGVINPSNPQNDTFQVHMHGNNERCSQYYWTPYIFKENENKVINVYTGEQVQILWNNGYPKTGYGDGWHIVKFNQEIGVFFNTNQDDAESCLVCNVSSSAVFFLRGNCEHSFLGTFDKVRLLADLRTFLLCNS